MEELHMHGMKKDATMMFNVSYAGEKKEQRCIGFASPSLLKLLSNDGLWGNLDATFCAPIGFYQVLIFGIMDKATGMFIPIFYVLMTSKDEEMYDCVLSNIVRCVGGTVDLKACMNDF